MKIGGTVPVLKYDGLTETIPIAGNVTVYTRSFQLKLAEYFGAFFKFTISSGSVDVKIELEESPFALTEAQEGSSNANWTEPDGMSDISAGIVDQNAHLFTLGPTPMPFARFKLTGGAGNSANCTAVIKVFLQEEV